MKISKNLICSAVILVSLLLSGGCVQSSLNKRKVTVPNSNSNSNSNSSNANSLVVSKNVLASSNAPGVLGATTTTTTSQATSSTAILPAKVELSHLVDPFDGTYKKKLTIPKNFRGTMYLAGLNINSIQDKILYTRFRFGLDRQPIVIDSTVTTKTAPGINSSTLYQVLALDFSTAKFQNVTLGYDLFDYNDYTSAIGPITDPRDNNLYCRGLHLVDDPTAITNSCSNVGDRCLYSYAKISDSSLYVPETVTGVYISKVPSSPMAWDLSFGSAKQFADSVCLPDEGNFNTLNLLFGTSLTTMPANDQNLFDSYNYRGPYKAYNTASWEIKGNAVFSAATGLFANQFDIFTGYKSNMFPKSGTLNLRSGMVYIGGTDSMFSHNTLFTVDGVTTGVTKFVDGCNLRAKSMDALTGEHVGSCNVTSSVEIFYYDTNGAEVIVASDKTIKLQLIKASNINNLGKEVLTTAFKTCNINNNTCGSDECCFNNRCWSKDLVSQCMDTFSGMGNLGIGNTCKTDLECSSFCCNNGTCSEHSPTDPTTPKYCSKPIGAQCITKEFCAQQMIKNFRIVFINNGASCRKEAFNVPTYADCKAGRCVPPATPADPFPNFNPANPDCSQAVNP